MPDIVYDAAGRLSGVSRCISGALDKTYASQFSYTSHGAPSQVKLGNNLWEHTNFNSRLQPERIGLGNSPGSISVVTFDYTYGTTNNNGNVLTQTIRVGGATPASFSQSYSYDSLNRLGSATETGSWSQTYGYDRYGNRWVSQSSGYTVDPTLTPTQQAQIDAATNRLLMPGMVYDTSGNQTQQARNSATETLGYDAENRMTTFTSGSTTTSYVYDGDGRRVKKVVGSQTTVWVYNIAGQLIAEYVSDPVPPPAGGGGTSYLTTDHLGSTRVVTKSDGTVKARYDYLPFGEQLGSGIGGRSVAMGYSAADSTRQRFTQKERDSESGLDYFGARYYSSAQGRFSSVDQLDPVMGKQGAEAKGEENAKRAFLDYLSKPQHWNRYLYVLNNPLRYIDPDGFQETITVGVQIVWDKNTQYSDKEKEEIKRRYLKEANKGLNRLGITLVVVAERTGTATNLANENRSIEGYTENNVNIFFTKNNSLPSTEVTRYDEGSIFIQTHTPNFFFPGESSTDSDLALHGSLHAFGLSVAKTGSYRAAERMVLITMEYLDKGDRAFVDIGDDRAAYEAMTPSLTKILRDGAQKYAIGRKVP